MSTRPVVAVLKTRPETAVEDGVRAMQMAGLKQAFGREAPVLLKVNISWHFWYPACSTTPWQLAAAIEGVKAAGFPSGSIAAAHNRTVVVSARLGERLNKHKLVTDHYGIADIHLYDASEEWVRYEPKARMRALGNMFPEGIRIPRRLIGANIVHLPTAKTHVFTTMTGAMKNAFGGLLFEKRHWTHSAIHETLVDLLAIQKEIHPGIFALMDATFAGDGAGPRAMRWHEKDMLLAGADQVAVDAIAARLMGFDPKKIGFIRMADEDGLGVGDPEEIEIVGDGYEKQNWGFRTGETFASRGQKLIYWGFLHRFERLLLRSFITPWSYLASVLYHDCFWYPLVGFWRARRALKTKWGRLFGEFAKVLAARGERGPTV